MRKYIGSIVTILGFITAIILLIVAVLDFYGRLPALTPTAAPSDPFTGTWEGIDSYDGSIVILSIVQTNDKLVGTANDTFTLNIEPPGYHGDGYGEILSPTTARIKFNLARWDGNILEWEVHLTLSDQNKSLTTDACYWSGDYGEVGCIIVLERK